MSFKNLKKYEVKADTSIPYELMDIEMGGKTPKLLVRPATSENKAYSKAQLGKSNKRIQRAAAKGISLETLDANREDDKRLYPLHIITGWEDVYDDEGNEVPFSVENCHEFIEMLPNWIFDNLRGFCNQAANFADTVNEDDLGN